VQQFQADNGAGKTRRQADEIHIDAAEAASPSNQRGYAGEQQRAEQRRRRGAAEQAKEFLRRQIQAQQKQQKDDADARDVLNKTGVGDQRQTPWPERRAQD